MLNKEKHRVTLIQILKDIYSNTSISSLLGFKGGTCVYLLYGLERFSVDLDFDLLKPSEADYVYQEIGKIIKKYGDVREERNKRYTLFFMLSYSTEAHNIKIEINKRCFGSKYEVKNFMGIPILAMKKEDLFANKLVAILDRSSIASRDIFDVWFFLKNNWEINKSIVEARTELAFNEYLKRVIKALEKINKRRILSGLGELVEDDKKHWIKESLVADLIFLLKARFRL